MKRERRSDISDLLELAQVNDAVNAPQLRQQELGQRKQQDLLSMALSLLGIQNQQQDATANRALTAQHYQDVLGEERVGRTQHSNEFAQTLGLQQSQENRLADAGRLSREEGVRHNQVIEGNKAKELDLNNLHVKLQALLGLPYLQDNPAGLETLGGLVPEFGVAQGKVTDRAHNEKLAALGLAAGAGTTPPAPIGHPSLTNLVQGVKTGLGPVTGPIAQPDMVHSGVLALLNKLMDFGSAHNPGPQTTYEKYNSPIQSKPKTPEQLEMMRRYTSQLIQ